MVQTDLRTRSWRMERGIYGASLLLLSLCGCQCGRDDFPSDSMSISPANPEAIAGGPPITLTVSGSLIVGSVSWSVDGPGTISPIDQLSASYAPPSSVPATTIATVAALPS